MSVPQVGAVRRRSNGERPAPVGRLLLVGVLCWLVPVALAREDGTREWLAVGLLAGSALLAQFATAWQAARLERQARERRDEVEVTRVAERRAMLRTLHDSMGQELTLIALQADAALRDEGSRLAVLEDIQRRSSSVLTDIGSFLRAAEEITPEAELDRAAAACTLRGVDCRVTGAVPVDIEPAAGGVLAAVIREAVTNVLRHAPEARWCRIGVESDARGTVTLTVVNDGHNPGGVGVTPGHGLLGLRERVTRQGGTLVVDTSVDDQFALRVVVAGGCGS